ncbi:LOB domain-containing protein 29-like [Olea europaea var. sylvestris]|uniref:LOB domain-containing protein 29-like n=1 Tax=Olea europaea var. sylvestris TaxID=158386 RepID=UPI000C1D3B45|nr:LOB domain-containing protein 29-like [Olea europaea var. sylvestris]
MKGSGSPCGACKFLRRKCVRGCVFAPYFSHEQGAAHFAAIHKVFGASNVSKLLAHLPMSDRCEAAVTISYEAQARVQDPIYGCVSHIFALQQQVVDLQAQLASLRGQAAQSILNSSKNGNPNEKFYCGTNSFSRDVKSWFQSSQNQGLVPQLDVNSSSTNIREMASCYENCTVNDLNRVGNYENSALVEENTSFGSMDSLEMQSNETEWPFQDDGDDLQSVTFRYVQHS